MRRLLAVTLLLCAASCTRTAPHPAPVLLFTGIGTAPGDVAAVQTILRRAALDFATADSAETNRLTPAQFRTYRLLIVPGGNFETIGKQLTPAASANLRSAVAQGLNYLGICAGAFFAGNSPYNGLNLTGGVRFGFYSAEARGIRKAAVPINIPGAPTLEHYWEDGPELTGWGTAIGRYPDGTPALAEGTYGNGWVVLAGFHPEAPASWRGGLTFTTPADAGNAFAATMIRAALDRRPLASQPAVTQ